MEVASVEGRCGRRVRRVWWVGVVIVGSVVWCGWKVLLDRVGGTKTDCGCDAVEVVL